MCSFEIVFVLFAWDTLLSVMGVLLTAKVHLDVYSTSTMLLSIKTLLLFYCPSFRIIFTHFWHSSSTYYLYLGSYNQLYVDDLGLPNLNASHSQTMGNHTLEFL